MDIKEFSKELDSEIEKYRSWKNNNFVAPDCEIPKDTPVENVLALKEALAEGYQI